MHNLDVLEAIKRIDKSNMRKLLYEFPYQGKKTAELMKEISLPDTYKRVKNIIVTGLGGSSVGGELLRNLLRERIDIPIMVNRSYTLPDWVNEETLLICISYSGNTEETLSAYKMNIKGRKSSSKTVVISSGGELISLAKNDNFPYVLIPGGMPPRTALGYLFFSQIFILRMLNLINIKDEELSETPKVLEALREENDIDTPKNKNIAKNIAEQIYGTIPIIYVTSDFLEGVGIRWKTQINENSKNLVYYQSFPEISHNEIMGWEKAPQIAKKFSVLVLKDKGESEEMVKRMGLTISLIKKAIARPLEIHSRGEGLLSRILSLIYIGDYVSFYLAILKGIDPTETTYIDKLKRLMRK